MTVTSASFTEPVPTTDVSDGELLRWMGTDGVRWARAFEQRYDHNDPDRLGTLIGWFANAIEAGRSAR